MIASRRALLLAVLGGVVFALTAPPTDLYPCAVLGLALLAAAIAEPVKPGASGFWRAFGRGALWGTAAGIVGLRFVPTVIQRFTPLGLLPAILALILLAAAQSLIWAVGAGVTSLLLRRARMPLELAFAAGVFVAVSLPTIFAWTPAGLVSPWPAFVQLADLIGERGVSALFALGAALLVRAAHHAVGVARDRRAALRAAAAAIGLFAALGLYGAIRLRAVAQTLATRPTVRVGLVDQHVDPHERWQAKNAPRILHTLRDLTRALEAQGVDLTIWPEAAYPYTLDREVRVAPRGARAILDGTVRGPILFGLITYAAPISTAPGRVEVNTYNSATLALPDGSLAVPYDKLQLLWFGETVPGGQYLPWLRRIFQKSGGLLPGDAPRALELPRDGGAALRMGVLNCYEDTLPDVGRRVTAALRPNLLVNVTNDAWFHGTAEPELHARLAAMRAIETRRDLVRAVNMGVTSWIDAAGVVRARSSGAAPATQIVTPAVAGVDLTPYARWGDAPLDAAFLLAIAACLARARRASRAPAGSAPPEPEA